MRRIIWGCALLLACQPLGNAQQVQQDDAQQKSAVSTPAEKAKARKGSKSKMASKTAEGDGKSASDAGSAPAMSSENGGKAGKPEQTIYDYELPGPDGKGLSMSGFKGKVILLVNLARNSSYNDQLPALIKLSEQFKDKGLVIIGIPSNDFGAAEPGTDVEIQKAYADAKVGFPVMAVSKLTGDEELPLYVFLTKAPAGGSAPDGGPRGGNGDGGGRGGPGEDSSAKDVHWNFTKFLIDRKGKLVSRIDPDVTPDSVEMQAALDKLFDNGEDKPHPGGQHPGHPMPSKNSTASTKSDSSQSNL